MQTNYITLFSCLRVMRLLVLLLWLCHIGEVILIKMVGIVSYHDDDIFAQCNGDFTNR